MRSILFLLSAHGALGECSGSECQAEEIAMLQHRRPSVRLAPTKTQSQALLERMQGVANSLTEGSDVTMSPDEVNEALETAHAALEELSPAIRQQVENAQQQINHAHAAVQVCHAEDQASLRASLHSSAAQYAAAVESCEATLQTLRQEEQEACDRAEDCLCDEARVRTSDQEALCASRTETYEVAWCEHHNVCTIFRNCHEDEAHVYVELRADVEAEMAVIVAEYIAVEQSTCLTNLIMAAMTPPLTPISHDALIACDDVDVSALSINFPDLPAEPAECPAPAVGAPECSVWDLIVHHEVSAGWFPGSVRNSLTHNADDPSSSLFMNVGQLTSSDYLTDGSYHFRVVFHDVAQAAGGCNDGPALSGDAQEFEWTQSSWITESSVTGYEPISPADLAASPHAGCVFSGLARSSTSATVFDGSPTHGNWFHSVGSTQVWHGGIPAFKGGAAQGVSLYVRKAGYSHHTVEPVTPEWTMVLQYGASAYSPNTGASGTLDESQKQFAKMSDAAINALPSAGEDAYDYYKLTSESASAGARDTLFVRAQGAYNDLSPTLGFSNWEVCTAASFDECTSWSVARGGTHGIDTYYPAATNNCNRWFTGYQNHHFCYPHGSSTRCWSTGNTCSLGSHAIRQDVKMYKKTA